MVRDLHLLIEGVRWPRVASVPLLRYTLFVRSSSSRTVRMEFSHHNRVVEGACGYLVKDRMQQAGMRWKQVGAQAVLDLRAVRLNGDRDAYWQFHREEQHARRYGVPPCLRLLRKTRRWSWQHDTCSIHRFWSHSFRTIHASHASLACS